MNATAELAEIPAASTPVHATETTLLVTTVHATERGYDWEHRLGSAASHPFSGVVPCLPAGRHENLLTLGHGTRTRRGYRTPAGGTVFSLLGTLEMDRLAALGTRWGRALNLLHGAASEAAQQKDLRPRTLQRAARWLEGGWAPAAEVLGAGGLNRLACWTEALAQHPERRLVHGHPGMAHFISDAAGERSTLLTGEDTGYAHWFYDYGWVLGEVAELHAFHPYLRERLDVLGEALMSQCPEPIDAADQHLARAYRLTHHAYDWHHHAGASLQQARLLLELAARYLQLSRAKSTRKHP